MTKNDQKEREKAALAIQDLILKTHPKEVQWLYKNKEIFVVRNIEKEMDLPRQTLQNFFTKRTKLKERHWKKVVKWVKSREIEK